MKETVALFWARRDLRLHDNAGFYAALSSGLPVVPVFIFDKEILSQLQDKDDKRVSFIYAALLHMQAELGAQGSTLDVRYGKTIPVFEQLLEDYNVGAVYTNRDYEPYATERDGAVAKLLASHGASLCTAKDQVIFEKSDVVKDDGTPYSIYTPYCKRWKATLTKEHLQSYPSEKHLDKLYRQKPRQMPLLETLGFVFDKSMSAVPSMDKTIIGHYDKTRDTPSVHGTTHLGIHLRFGTGSIRKLATTALALNETFLNELIWRDFFMQMLWHQPRLVTEACKPEYDHIKWRNNEVEFERWCQGKTGYPIVDAGMRELNETGFMHNRVRMIAGSFLVKDLLIDWRWGEAHFARKLLDFELASNNGNWQWVAGCGCDAAPYFRVFNPTIQAKKFDPQLKYIKKWIPELESFDYPEPIVEHDKAKERCLQAYKAAVAYKTHFSPQ